MTEAWRGSTCDRCGMACADGAMRCPSCNGHRRIPERATSWLDDAACAGLDVNAFFPSKNAGRATDYTLAKRICAGCPVRQECLDDADAIEPRGKDGRYGVRGGLTPAERAERARDLDPARAAA